jgi:acetyl esterase/lipase
LANHGWVGLNADYRLSPRATFPDHVVDVKRALAWVRDNAGEYGADPGFVCITGGSAGGHLCALAALTADDPELQPGFDDVDTSVAAAVPFYGVYDLTDPETIYYPELRRWVLERNVFKTRFADEPERFRAACVPTRPRSWSSTASPTPWFRSPTPAGSSPSGEHPRARCYTRSLAGAEHAFDIVPSVRTARVMETIERFLATIRAEASNAARLQAIG